VYGVCVVTSDKNSEKGAMATCRRKNGVVVLLCVCVLCIYNVYMNIFVLALKQKQILNIITNHQNNQQLLL